MAESPTKEQVLIERPDLQDYIEGNNANLDIDDYIAKALAQVKRDIVDVEGIKWSRIYSATTGDYLPDVDGEETNKDRMHNLITIKTVAMVFEDYSIRKDDEGVWNGMMLAYMAKYDKAFDEVKLSVDWNDSGVITEDEEEQNTQKFMGR